MKQTYLSKSLILAAALFVASCNDMTVTTGDGSNKVDANGKVTSEEREIPPFNQIVTEGVFNIYLLQKDKEAIRIQADENVLPYITTEVTDGVLNVKLKEDTKLVKAKKINIYITLKDITKIQNKGVGTLHCMDTLKLKAVELGMHGVGETKLLLHCDSLTVKSEMVGALFLEGRGKSLTIDHKGVGAFNAFKFMAENVKLESDGIGKVELYASKDLWIEAKGLGGVVYKGNPERKHIKNKGVGVVASEGE